MSRRLVFRIIFFHLTKIVFYFIQIESSMDDNERERHKIIHPEENDGMPDFTGGQPWINICGKQYKVTVSIYYIHSNFSLYLCCVSKCCWEGQLEISECSLKSKFIFVPNPNSDAISCINE